MLTITRAEISKDGSKVAPEKACAEEEDDVVACAGVPRKPRVVSFIMVPCVVMSAAVETGAVASARCAVPAVRKATAFEPM
mmetsp:Transcript_56625/g.134897  ORF Transcript_56625/g.134897 Transcript_56625/m.134897 type:complete len:81 (-) Transcript_56625:126-368(-)